MRLSLRMSKMKMKVQWKLQTAEVCLNIFLVWNMERKSLGLLLFLVLWCSNTDKVGYMLASEKTKICVS